MPRNGDAGLTATRGRTVPPCRKGPSARTGRMPTPRLPHPLARLQPVASWASAPAAPAAGTGAGPSPHPEPRPAQRRRATRPVPAPPAGPPGTGKRPGLRPGNSPAGRARPLSAAEGRCSPKRRPRPAAGPLPAGRMQHAHRAPRLPAPEMEVRRSGEIFQPGRKMPRHRDSLPCRGQGAEQQRGVFRLRHPALPDHAPCPASFWTISCPMTKA